jgi:carbamoyltransferase
MKKCYIGISLGFNSSASIITEEGIILAAISEERLIRQKNTKRIPVSAINECLKHVDFEKYYIVDYMFYSHYDGLDLEYFHKYDNIMSESYDIPEQVLLGFINSKCNLNLNNITGIDHHTAHAFSVIPYYTDIQNQYYNSMIITSDGYGDGLSFTARSYQDMSNPILSYGLTDSIALVYQFVTGALGMKEHQHEGKVTGLAAYGNNDIASKWLEDFYYTFSKKDTNEWNYLGSSFNELRNDVYDFVKVKLGEDFIVSETSTNVTNICKMVQLFVEEETIKRLRKLHLADKHLYFAGGLHANVALNTLISKKIDCKSVNITPAMGDEGTAVGCVLAGLGIKEIKHNPYVIFSGIDVDESIVSVKQNLLSTTFKNDDELIESMTDMLSCGKIVHYRSGRSEFGPRALCHSSTFYQAIDPSGTKLLNKTLGRSEFMPYAPIVLIEDIDDLFEPNQKIFNSLIYMTACLKAKPETFYKYRGAIHIDMTARIQLLTDASSFAYRLLKRYREKTGLKMLINTSWNIHNNPTVATVADSFLTWEESGYCGEALVHNLTMYKKVNEQLTKTELDKKLDKLQWSVLPWEQIERICKVFDSGARKYGEDGWKQLKSKTYKDAMMRHVVEYMKNDESKDSESGMKHILHIAANAIILDWFGEHEFEL